MILKTDTRSSSYFLLLLCVCTIGMSACTESFGENTGQIIMSSDAKSKEIYSGKMVKAFTLDAWDRPEEDLLERLSLMGVTHLSLTSFGWQSNYDHPEVHMQPDARWYTESDSGIKELAEEGKKFGIQIIVKPHIWLSNSAAEEFYQGKTVITKKWRSDIGFETEEEWKIWEETYKKFALHYASLAEEVGADIYCIGTELANAAKTRPDYWRGLIKEIRKIYKGKLTYAGNWYQEYEDIPFWKELDLIGIQAYFPISKEESPTKDDLLEGWKRHYAKIKAVSDSLGKAVLFTELGYRSVSFAAEKPWQWANRNEMGKVQPDYEMQADLYEAFFETYWEEDWFAGVIFWKWQPESDRRRGRGRRDIDFTPQDKPAQETVKEWFNKE